ncbi:hypothetical protein F2Q70_00000055 [Brassica cretica]|uniref:PIPK domain-containing protein n=1 Tax=Brassica cretica TaxID=69181 RepID=A0A8S9IXR7_BRACR|nr:hypothetical protein F2Q70_00000055 [Brassica cretica]
MGSLESGIPPAKRERQHHHPLLQRNRSRSFLFKRFSYIQWICSTCVFFFFVVLFQMFLPGLVIDKSDKPPWRSIEKELLPPDMLVFKERGVLSFGDDVRLEPTKLLMSFQRDNTQTSSSVNGVNPVYGSFTPPCSLKSDSTNSLKTALNSPDSSFTTFYSCPPSRESVESENSMTSNSTSLETNLINRQSKLATLSDLFVNSCSSTNFGMKIPARARREKRAAGEEEEWYDVVLYLGIVDTFQDYGMKKRIEHCYKTIQHNSNSISTVHPKIYSSRFQEFVSNIFLPRDDGDLSL